MLYAPAPLHIPDGFLSLLVAGVCWAITILALTAAIRSTGTLGEKQVPLMGIMAAFIFAAQMINFPVAGGTSGHLLGGALAAIVLGPWPAMLVMTAVIGVQGLLFQDGGLIVMGANILNMGLLTVVIGYGLYRFSAGRPRGARLALAGVGAWLSVMAGALATSLQLWLSGTAKLEIVIPTMLAMHALIGLGEALITVGALGFILALRPDLVDSQAGSARGGRGWALAGLGIALSVVLLAPYASADPDGLERAAIDLGFMQQAVTPDLNLLPDYTLPFLGANSLSTILAGLIGALAVAGLVFLLARLLVRKPEPAHADLFDRFHAAVSPLHQRDPRIKVLVVVAYIISNALLPDAAWLAFGLSWLLLLAANRAARLGLGFTLRRSFVALPFALVAFSAMFSLPGRELADWSFGPLTLIVTDLGVLRFISILIRSWLSVQAAILLVAVTPFPDLIHAFDHLRVPGVLVTIVAFLYRYLFVLTDEVLRLMRARQSRAAAIPGRRPGRTVLWRARTAGDMVGQLFLRSYERSDRIYHAMLSRGYTGQLRTLNPHQITRLDRMVLALTLIGLLLLQFGARFPWS